MAKIASSVQDEEEGQEQQDSRLETEQEVSGKQEISTRKQINALKRAKIIAKSDDVKKKLQEEIDLAEIRLVEEREAERERLETISRAQETAKATGNVIQGVAGAASNVGDRVGELASNVGGTIATVSTPGSIFLPITLLLIFFFLILPVNGMTRAQWLWLALTGGAQIVSGSGGNFTSGSGDIGEPDPSTGDTITSFSRGAFTNQYIRRKT